MKIFVSWSGEKSRLYAEALKDWLEQCIQSVEVFFSSEDIEKGINWNTKLSTELSDTNFGIVCLTNDNISAPWIHFEAGALSKFLSSKVTALVTDISISDIKGPLASFQATKLEKEDMLKLLKSINKELEHPIEEERLTRNFNAFYNDFEDKIKKIDFNMLSYIILNEVEMSELTQCDNPKDGLKYFAKNYPKLKIIITLGSEGSMYGDTEKVVFQLSFKVNAVDTTAAGDTFTGYFFAQTAMGNTVEKSLKIASVASAIAVSRKGASVSIPMLNEVLAAENSFQSS